MTNNFNLMN